MPTAEPVITRRSRFPLVWVTPIIALLIGGWLIYKEMVDKGPTITVTFEDGSGLETKTPLNYKGVGIGTVTRISLSSDLQSVQVRIQLDRSAADIAREDSQFWIVRPEIGLEGITGLDTILSGQYITVQPGKGAPATHFQGLSNAPPAGQAEPGINLLLQADRLGSVSEGSPVYYREVQVGTVDRFRLAGDAASVLIHVHIKQPYDALIRENTRFWNASGIGFDLSLFGAKISTESLAALLAGGIAFATPDNDQMGSTVSAGSLFTLHNELDKSWLDWKPAIPLDFKNGPDGSNGFFPDGSQKLTQPQQETHSPASPPLSTQDPAHPGPIRHH